MKLVFFGTAGFALPALRALVEGGRHEVALVVTQPDRPRGRHGTPSPPPVKELAAALGIPAVALAQPARLRKALEIYQRIEAASPRAAAVVAYGQLIPKALLSLPPLGCLNVHGSLLPRWRGAAPVQRAIQAGDRETGVSIIRLTPRLDAGPVLARRAVPIGEHETSGELLARLAPLGAALLLETLDRLERGEPVPEEPQDETPVTLAPPIDKAAAALDFAAAPAAALARAIRAFSPEPGAFAFLARAARPGDPPRRVTFLRARACASCGPGNEGAGGAGDRGQEFVSPGARPGGPQTAKPDAAREARAGASVAGSLPTGAASDCKSFAKFSGGDAGTVLRAEGADLWIAAADGGAVAIDLLKPEGKREMSAAEFLRGRGAARGDRFLQRPGLQDPTLRPEA